MRRLRRQRVRKGRCPDCGKKCRGYRCAGCNLRRREPMRLLQQRAKVRRQLAAEAAGTV